MFTTMNKKMQHAMGIGLLASVVALTGCSAETNADPEVVTELPASPDQQADFETLKNIYLSDSLEANHLTWNEETQSPNLYDSLYVELSEGSSRYGMTYPAVQVERDYVAFGSTIEVGEDGSISAEDQAQLEALAAEIEAHYAEIELTEQSILMSILVSLELLQLDESLTPEIASYLVDDAAYYAMLIQQIVPEEEQASLLDEVYLFNPETYQFYGRLALIQENGVTSSDGTWRIELQFVHATDEMEAAFKASDFYLAETTTASDENLLAELEATDEVRDEAEPVTDAESVSEEADANTPESN